MLNHEATGADGGLHREYQKRMQWPHAAMTRDEFCLHQRGELLHRDYSVVKEGAFTFVGEFEHARSRQDAPNGWPRDMPYNSNK